MSTPVNDTVYKSPKHKLLAFFERSRNQWRARAKDYQQEKRVLQIHLRDVEASRDHWRQRYFEERAAQEAGAAHRGHEPPRAGGLARRSLTREMNA
jgi:hypothetical protein